VSAFIDQHRARFGVEPICRELQVAPSTYYAAKARGPSRRAQREVWLQRAIAAVHADNYGVYGADKVWAALNRQGVAVARCTVERLMQRLGLRGAVRGRVLRTTRGVQGQPRPADLVQRVFQAPAPNRLWVADFTYVRTQSGWVYVAFIIDVYSRRLVGWQAATSPRRELAQEALETALWQRRGERLDRLVHHSDRGSQYVAVRYSERLAAVGALASVGSKGDSYDNALAESTIGLYKTELVHRHGPWPSITELELATLTYVDWWNHRRLHGALGLVPPSEREAAHHATQLDTIDTMFKTERPRLH